MIAALWLLVSCSEAFGPAWTYEASGFHLGLRQSAFSWVASAEGSVLKGIATSGTTDLLRSNPRAITRAERPFIQLWIKISSIPNNPSNYGHGYFGFRVTEMVEPNQMVWPGCFVGRDTNGTPTLFLRALADNLPTGFIVTESAWLTLGLAWAAADGAIQIYAHEGRVDLTESDLIAYDNGTIWNGTAWETQPFYIKHMTEVRGLFLDVASVPEQPEWALQRIAVYADVLPTLSIEKTNEAIRSECVQLGAEGVAVNICCDSNCLGDVAALAFGGALTLWDGLPINDLSGAASDGTTAVSGENPQPQAPLASLTLSVSGYPTEPYQLQRSTDLATWETIGTATSGNSVVDVIASEQQFYRLTQ